MGTFNAFQAAQLGAKNPLQKAAEKTNKLLEGANAALKAIETAIAKQPGGVFGA